MAAAKVTRIGASNCRTIDDGSSLFLQSYATVVAKISDYGKLTLDPAWEISTTTVRHVTRFLCTHYEELTPGDVRYRIAKGIIKVKPLNH